MLPPILAAFHHEHLGIAIELALANRNQDLARRDARWLDGLPQGARTSDPECRTMKAGICHGQNRVGAWNIAYADAARRR